jgi:hypothetical protein
MIGDLTFTQNSQKTPAGGKLAFCRKYDIWLIMLLAFFVRMIGYKWMGYTNFPEFYRDYYMVSGIAHGTQAVLLGPPSMLHGFHFGPFYYYSMLPFFLLFGGHPFGLIFTGIVFSVLTVYVFFKILLLWSNSRGLALAGALFTALSVYSLHLASYTSNPNFLPLFVLWYFYYLIKILGGAKNKDYVLLGLAFGLATQLHATAMIVLPLVTITTLIINKYRPRIKTAAIFLATVVLTYLPYLFYECTHRFANFSRLFILGTRELGGRHLGAGLYAIWNFFQGTLTPFNYWYSYSNIQPNILYLVVAAAALFVLFDLLYKIFKKQKGAQTNVKISKEGLTIILSWIFFTCAVLLMFDRGVHDHYIIILWPVPMIILAYAVFWMKARFNIFASLIMLIVITSLLQIYSFYQFGRTPWSAFWPEYQSHYQNQPGVSEIGS